MLAFFAFEVLIHTSWFSMSYNTPSICIVTQNTDGFYGYISTTFAIDIISLGKKGVSKYVERIFRHPMRDESQE
jgi:hypothetical protein